jgi:hypothetical protein
MIVSVIARSHIQLKIKQSKKTDSTTMLESKKKNVNSAIHILIAKSFSSFFILGLFYRIGTMSD